MRAVSAEILASLQKNPKNIRHICILAHVDHGKTTLADSVLASNGIISKRIAGQLRYMDSRKDEQERGITMKSSAVAVHYQKGGEDYLINVIDSPGHVDFAGEVSTAVRLCDGAIILVDVIEGICPQTKNALHQAWIEHIKPLLVLNKIDRLILEWKLTPLDAYAHLVQILEQINAVVGELFTSDILKKSENKHCDEVAEEEDTASQQVFDWSSGLDDSDDSKVYFSPEQGNVIFACALDGWGFGISHFAKLYATKLGAKEKVLRKTLWGDFYLNSKTKQIMKGAQTKAKKPLFVQLILENIWSVYDAVLVKRDKAMVEKIAKSLNLTILARDSNLKDPKVCLKAIFGQWLPLSSAILEMVCGFVPNPLELGEEKVEGLMCASAVKFDILPRETQQLKADFMKCSSSEDAPIIVCISKMFPVEKKMLPENRQKPLTPEEIAMRREAARQMHAEQRKERELAQAKSETPLEEEGQSEPDVEEVGSDTAFIAFARVYSGTVHKGQQLYVLGPKHDPEKALNSDATISEKITVHDLNQEQHITLATIKHLYLLMGKELVELDSVPAGNVIGIGGLEDHVLKSATLSNTVACPSFIDLHSSTVPIVRVALEPVQLKEMPALVKGMRLLNQADPCVQVFVQESGEHVLVSSGEVHLQRCIDDLKERFAKIDINVSSPIVPFRETIILPPKIDMVNEAIDDKFQTKKSFKVQEESSETESINCEVVTLKTPNKLSCIRMHAKPLPPEVTKLLEENSAIIKIIDQSYSCQCSGEEDNSLTQETINRISVFKNKLNELFLEAGSEWTDAVEQIWSFGPKKCGPNILLNCIPSYKRSSIWTTKKTDTNSEFSHFSYDSTFISGFQLASLCGPLCDEPMMGVCFVVDDWTFENDVSSNICDDTEDAYLDDLKGNDLSNETLLKCETGSVNSSGFSSTSSTPFGPFTGQIMSTVKEASKKAFQAQPQRLMCAMYSCNIQVATDMLGKMYAVLGRRHGRVLHADIQEGSQTFHVTAELPVIESFDFANEIRKQTSGMALPQLVFSHWEVVDVDPFWTPRTEEEYTHFGEKADVENRARKYMNNVRRRKGLYVDEKIVEHAEKQRTKKK